MEISDIRLRLEDPLPVHPDDEPQDSVRRGMLRPEVQLHFLDFEEGRRVDRDGDGLGRGERRRPQVFPGARRLILLGAGDGPLVAHDTTFRFGSSAAGPPPSGHSSG